MRNFFLLFAPLSPQRWFREMLLIAVVLAVIICSFAQPAKAYWLPPAPPPVAVVASCGAACGPAFWPFFGAVALASFVVYANAEGINFPLCGLGGLKCEYSYPGDNK